MEDMMLLSSRSSQPARTLAHWCAIAPRPMIWSRIVLSGQLAIGISAVPREVIPGVGCFTILHNLAINQLRQKTRRGRHVAIDDVEEATAVAVRLLKKRGCTIRDLLRALDGPCQRIKRSAIASRIG